MTFIVAILVSGLIFTIGFWMGRRSYSNVTNQGKIICGGPELDEVQQIGQDYVRTHVEANYSECASLYAEDAIYMVPGRSALKGRGEIKEYLRESFTTRGHVKILEMKEPAEEVIVMGDYVAVRGIGYNSKQGEDSSITHSTYKWMVLAKKNLKGRWEMVWDIYNND